MSRVLKYILAIAVLCLLVYEVNLHDLVDALSKLTLTSVFWLLVVAAALIYVSAWKWGLFIENLGVPFSLFRLFNLYLVGYFVNLILPSYLGGDAVRSWYVGKKIGQHEALAATILERYTGIVAMVTLAVLFMWFVPFITHEIEVAVACVAVGLIAITLIAIHPGGISMIERIPQARVGAKHLRKIQAALQFAGSHRGLLVKSLLLSFLYHTLTVVNTVIAAQAVGWMSPPVGDLFVVLPLILLVGAIPLAPNGLGIQEGAFFFFLTGIGATPAQALGIGVVLRAKSYLLAMIGGVSWWFERGRIGESGTGKDEISIAG